MTVLHGVERTVRLPLLARAEEHVRPDRLFDDATAVVWSESLEPDDELDAWFRANPASALSSNIRTRIIDDTVTEFLQKRPDGLIVELGAGLTTRRQRLGSGRWLLVDFPAVIDLLEELAAPDPAYDLLAGDLRDPGWLSRAPDAPSGGVLVIAEGVLFFLRDGEIRRLFRALAAGWTGCELIFDVMRPIHLELLKQQFDQFAGFGAPIRSYYEPEDVAGLGVRAIDLTFLLIEFSERWDAFPALSPEDRIPENSSYLVHGVCEG